MAIGLAMLGLGLAALALLPDEAAVGIAGPVFIVGGLGVTLRALAPFRARHLFGAGRAGIQHLTDKELAEGCRRWALSVGLLIAAYRHGDRSPRLGRDTCGLVGVWSAAHLRAFMSQYQVTGLALLDELMRRGYVDQEVRRIMEHPRNLQEVEKCHRLIGAAGETLARPGG
jgi:hypothetical protein